MKLKQHITLRPSLTYLFSYVWLAGELLLFNYIIQFYFTSISFPLTVLIMLCFARLYYWLDFSMESGVQTFFILGVIPIIWIVNAFDLFENFMLILFLYTVIFIVFGFFRILTSKYKITNTKVIHVRLRKKAYEIDRSRLVELDQHARGKLLNFGCILIPIKDPKKKKGSLISTLFFHQRNSNKYHEMLRIDGVPNAKQALKIVKQHFNDD